MWVNSDDIFSKKVIMASKAFHLLARYIMGKMSMVSTWIVDSFWGGMVILHSVNPSTMVLRIW